MLLVALLARAEEPAGGWTRTGVLEFAAAYRAWDAAQFAAAASSFRQATTNAPANPTNFYWLGVAEFHRMLQIQSLPSSVSNRVPASVARDAALAAFTTAVKLAPKDAESHALLGTLYGMKIDGNLIRGARFGPRVAEHSKQALELGAQNPRVRYLLGTCQFHTAKNPAKQREALATFLQAEKLFAAEANKPAGPLEPRWGHATCLTFIGRTYEQLGERTSAADYYRKALALHPADHLAKEGLARVTKEQ
jgi:tetratricopeptide (TPR) repeat protein